MWLLVAVIISCVCSWLVAVVVLLLLDSWGCLPWYGDGFVVGQHVVVAIGSIIGGHGLKKEAMSHIVTY